MESDLGYLIMNNKVSGGGGIGKREGEGGVGCMRGQVKQRSVRKHVKRAREPVRVRQIPSPSPFGIPTPRIDL